MRLFLHMRVWLGVSDALLVPAASQLSSVAASFVLPTSFNTGMRDLINHRSIFHVRMHIEVKLSMGHHACALDG